MQGQLLAAAALTATGSLARDNSILYTKTSAAAHHRERRKMTPRVFLLRCFPDHFSSPTQLRTNNDYDHWCQFQGGYRTGPRRCPRTSTHVSKSIAAVCGGVCVLLVAAANESGVISFFLFLSTFAAASTVPTKCVRACPSKSSLQAQSTLNGVSWMFSAGCY